MQEMIDVNSLRKQFPALNQRVYGKPLVYLDNAATTQKPIAVIDALKKYYEEQNANIHRGVHFLSQQATEAFEESRNTVKNFIEAENAHEIIFTRGTTESINLVAASFGKQFLKPGDEVIISAMEHHSNIVPWQMACETHGAILKVIPINKQGELIVEYFTSLLGPKTRIVALTHISNALGTVNPVKEIIRLAHQRNIPVLIDGAQAVLHKNISVTDLDCDFYCFSAHKMYAPMGVGVLYGKEKWLEALPPYQGGGEMIKEVSFEKTTYNELPFKFEAGTPNVGDVIGLKTAIQFLRQTNINNIEQYENSLLLYATKKLSEFPEVQIIGTAAEKSGVLSFILKGIHSYDAGTLLDKMGIAVRTGHHCAQPVMDFYQIPGTIRASIACYNTSEEIDVLCNALKKIIEIFK